MLPVAESELIGAYNARTRSPAPTTPLRRLPLAGGVAAGTSRHSRGPGPLVIVAAIVGIGIVVALATREPPQRLAKPTSATAPVVAPAPQPAQPVAPSPEVTAPAPAPAVSPPAPATAPAAAGAAAPAPAAPVAAPNQLVLEFSEASFVRVEDSRNKTLAIGLVRGGERHALDGVPPYTVFLGNAQNVKVFYGGAAVDFSAHVNRQNDTARFTVP